MGRSRSKRIGLWLLAFVVMLAGSYGGSPPPIASANVPGTIILDSHQSTGISRVGTWVSTSTGSAYNGSYYHDNNTNKGNSSVTYTPTIPAASYYAVSIYWPTYQAASNTPITIDYQGGSVQLVINQRNNGTGWVFLGTFPFQAGSSGNLTIRNNGTNGRVIADAVKFEPSAAVSLTPVAAPNAISLPTPSDAYDTMRNKWIHITTGWTMFNPNDPVLANKLYEVNARAQQFWNTMNKSTDRTHLWLAIGNGNSSTITSSYRALRDMAIAFHSPYTSHGFQLAGNTQLLADIIDGMEWIYNRDPAAALSYNENKAWGANWWDLEIGAALALNDLTAMLYPYLTSAQRTKYMNTVERFSPDPTKFYYDPLTQPGFNASGANRIWKSKVVAVRGVLVKNSAKLASSRDALSAVLAYTTSGDGFYTDGSFIQHGSFPYAAGYGAEILYELSDVMELLDSTTWQVTDPNVANVFKWVYDSFEPFVYKGDPFGSVQGRSTGIAAAQNHSQGHNMMRGIAQLVPFAPAADAVAYKRMIKQWVLEDTAYMSEFYRIKPMRSVAIVRNIVNDGAIAPRGELIMSKVFPSMDRNVHLRPGFGFGLALTSSRTSNYESLSGHDQNKKGWYTGDGMTYLYNNDLRKYSDDFWATVNHYRLPGTTVDTQTRYDTQAQNVKSGTNWAGGTDIAGLYSTVGMEVAPYNVAASGSIPAYVTSLTAKKSWFMFDDEIVALGSGITSSSGRTIETIMENYKIRDTGNNALSVNGVAQPTTLGWSATMSNVQTVHMEGNVAGADVGFYLPSPATVKGLREARTKSWQDVDKNGGTTLITRNYLNLWLDHGTAPSNQTYAYAILPNKTSSQTTAYASNPHIQVLANTGMVQAVKEQQLNLIGANFWTDQSVTVMDQGSAALTSNKKASVMVRESAGQLELSVSDPTQANTGTIELEIHRSASSVISASPGVTVIQTSPTIKVSVQTSGAKGKTFRAFLQLGQQAPQEIIVDNTDPQFSVTGAWSMSNTSPGFYGNNYHHDGTSGADTGKTATWTPSLTQSGTYEVYMRWTSHSNRPNAAPVDIQHSGGMDSSITVNQRQNGGTWVLLGTYTMSAGTGNFIRIHATNAGYTIADAVRLVKIN